MGFLDNIINAGRKAWSALKEDKQTPPAPDLTAVKAAEAGAEALIDVPKDLPKETKQILSGQGSVAGDIQPIKPLAPQQEEQGYVVPEQPDNIFTKALDAVPKFIENVDNEILNPMKKMVGNMISDYQVNRTLDRKTMETINNSDLFSDMPKFEYNDNVIVNTAKPLLEVIKDRQTPDIKGMSPEKDPMILLDKLNEYDNKNKLILEQQRKKAQAGDTNAGNEYYAKMEALKTEMFGPYVKDPSKINDAMDFLRQQQGTRDIESQLYTETYKKEDIKASEDSYKKNAEALGIGENTIKKIMNEYNTAYTTAGGEIGTPLYTLNVSMQMQTIQQQLQEGAQVIGGNEALPDEDKRKFYTAYEAMVMQQARVSATEGAFYAETDPAKLALKEDALKKAYGKDVEFEIEGGLFNGKLYNFAPIGKDDKLESFLKGVNEYSWVKGYIDPNLTYLNEVKDNITNAFSYITRRSFEPIINNTIGRMVDSPSADKNFIQSALNNALDPNYEWNQDVTLFKRVAEVGIDLAATKKFMGGLEGMAAKQIAKLPLGSPLLAPAAGISAFGVNTVGSSLVNGMILANFPTSKMDNQMYDIDTFFDGATAIFEGLKTIKQMNTINKSFNRTLYKYPQIVEFGIGSPVNYAQAQSIVQTVPVYASVIKRLYKTAPEETELMMKKSMYKTQIIKAVNEELVPEYVKAMKETNNNVNASMKRVQEYWNKEIAPRFTEKEKLINQADKNFQDVAEAGEVNYVNSMHDKPSLTKIQEGTPNSSGDPILDLVNDMGGTQTKTYSSIASDLNITLTDTKTSITNKIAKIYSGDLMLPQLLDVIKYKNINGEMIMFDGEKPTPVFNDFINTKGINLPNTVRYLADVDRMLAISNATNSSHTMVGRLKYDTVQFIKASEEELANPDIPKFKIDQDQIVPVQPSTEVMVKNKKYKGKSTDFSMDAEDIATKQVDGTTYVTSPIELQQPIKKQTINNAKVSGEDGQKIYLDYRKKIDAISPRKQEITAKIDTSNIYEKLYKSIDGDKDLNKHIKVSKILDNIIDSQLDSMELLNMIDTFTPNQIDRFVDYFESLDPTARQIFLNEYDGEFKSIVNIIDGKGFDEQDIALQNFVADLLVKRGTFSTRKEAQEMLRKFKNEFLASLTKGIKEQDKTDAKMTKNVWPQGTIFAVYNTPVASKQGYKDMRRVMSPIERFLDDPKIQKLRETSFADVKVYFSKDLVDRVGEYDPILKQIVILDKLTHYKPYTFAHEFGHAVFYKLNANTKSIVYKAYHETLDILVDELSKQKNITKEEALQMITLDNDWIRDDSKNSLDSKYYRGINVKEFFSEERAATMLNGKKSKHKGLRKIIDEIILAIKRFIAKLDGMKSYQGELFKDLWNNIEKHLDSVGMKEQYINPDDEAVMFLKKKVSIRYENDINKSIDVDSISPEDQKILYNLNTTIDQYIQDVGFRDKTSILNFLGNLESKIESIYPIGSEAYNTATKILNVYYGSIFNGSTRNLIELPVSTDMKEAVAKKLSHEDIVDELDIVKPAIENMLVDMKFNTKDFSSQIDDAIKIEANKLKGKFIDTDILSEARNNIQSKIQNFAVSQGIADRKMTEEKFNTILDVVATNNMNVAGSIYTVNFNDVNDVSTSLGLKGSFVREIYNASFSENQIRLPLPGNTRKLTVAFDFKKGDPMKQKIQGLYNKIIKDHAIGSTVYVFGADDGVIKRRDMFIKNPSVNVIFVQSKIHSVSLKVDNNMLMIESDNPDIFTNVQKQLADVVVMKDQPIGPNTAWIVQDKANITPIVMQYLSSGKMPDNVIEKFSAKPIETWKGLVAAKNKWYEGTYSYDFIDINQARDELSPLIKAKGLDTFTIDKGLIYTMNEKYGFQLDPAKFEFKGPDKDIIFDYLLRTYISPSHSEAGWNEINLLYRFMDTTDNQTMRDWNERKRSLSYKGTNLGSPIVRKTIRDLVFDKLYEFKLNKPVANYILSMSDIVEDILSNMSTYKQLELDLLEDKRRKSGKGKDPMTYYEGKIEGQLGAFLEQYFENNKKSLKAWYNRFEKNISDLQTPDEMTDVFETEMTVFAPKQETSTLKKGIALAFINNSITEVLKNPEAIKSRMQYGDKDVLENGYYILNRTVYNYINGIYPLGLDGTIEKMNLPRRFEGNRAPLLAQTKEYFKNAETLIDGFFDNKIAARRNIAGSGKEKFTRKMNIENLFGEISYQLRNYSKALEYSFGGHPETKIIIRDIKKKLFQLDRPAYASTENLMFLKKDFDKIKKTMVDGHNAIVKVLAKSSAGFDYKELIRTGETVKLGIAKNMLGDDMMVFDKYPLSEFLRYEGQYLGYPINDKVINSKSTIIQQVSLLGMYTEVLQKMIDDVAVGNNSYSMLYSNYMKDLKLKNPVYIGGGIDLDSFDYVRDEAKGFFKGDANVRINMYNMLYKKNSTRDILKLLFENSGLLIDDGVIKAIDRTAKAMITNMGEAYFKSGLRDVYVDIEKVSGRITQYAFWSAVESILKEDSLIKIKDNYQNIKENIKQYADEMGDMTHYYMDIGARSAIASAEVIKQLKKNTEKYVYVMNRLNGIVNALQDLDWHEVTNAMGGDRKITVLGEPFKLIDVFQDKAYKALFNLNMQKVADRMVDDLETGIIKDNKEFGERGFDVEEALQDIYQDGADEVFKLRKQETLEENPSTPKEWLANAREYDQSKLNYVRMQKGLDRNKTYTDKQIKDKLRQNLVKVLRKGHLVDYYDFGKFVELKEFKNPIYEPTVSYMDETPLTNEELAFLKEDAAKITTPEIDEDAYKAVTDVANDMEKRNNELKDFLTRCFD